MPTYQAIAPSHIQLIPVPELRQELGLFGYELPYLPDFMRDHTLLGQTAVQRLDEVLGRLERFVAGLRKYRDMAYALRFIHRPERGAIEVTLLGRALAAQGHGGALAVQAGADLSAHLAGFGMPHRPLLPNGEGPQALMPALMPFGSNYHLVEIRQHERVVPLVTVNQEAYVVHPYWRPTGAGLEAFEALLRQSTAAAISIYLEPTEIEPQEYQSLAEAAYLAQTVADVNVAVTSATSIQRRRDPGAEIVGRIYTAYLRSLVDPFLVTVQVAGVERGATWAVARAYASSMISDYRVATGEAAERALPSATDLIAPDNPADLRLAQRGFNSLVWSPWGATQASPEKLRLRYLAGAQAASTAFRFPISVQGGVPGIAVRQSAPDFEPGARPHQAGPNEVVLGHFRRGGLAVAPLQDFARHALITGFTGSGKTNTVVYLLDQFWTKHRIPFLVIETAKKEYRALKHARGFQDLLVFTLGDETCLPFRLNPFELLPGVRVEAHLGRLQACFDAALPQFGILPSIVAEAMERIYSAAGWRPTDRGPAPEAKDPRAFPSLHAMYAEVVRVAERRGYAGETLHNIRAAAAGRIGGLLQGSKGRMFGARRSLSADVIFSRPVVLELNDLNADDKALTMMFLLTWLREYRELHPTRALQHIAVVEEAHNVLSNTQSVGNTEVAADTKAKAVGAFANLLSEVRAYGQGLIISDQSPEKLAPDAVRNTNLQIAHQLRDRRDREAIGRAMLMDDTQQDYLGKLGIGEAALFRTGIEKATFIQVPEFKDSAGFDTPPSDDDLRLSMPPFQKKMLVASLPYGGCQFCTSQCLYRETLEPQALDKQLHARFQRALKRFDEKRDPALYPAYWRELAGVCVDAARAAGSPGQLDAAFCYLAAEINFEFTEHMRREFQRAYAAVSAGPPAKP